MVMTRGLKRKVKEKEGKLSNGEQRLISIIPGFSSNLLHQGADSRTRPYVPSKVNPCNSESKVSQRPSTMAKVKAKEPLSQAFSVATTSGRYPFQYFRHVSCKRNISTADTGAIKKLANDSKVANETHMGTPLSEIHHSPTIKASVTQPLSPTPFPFQVVDNLHTSTEQKSSQVVITPITEDRSKSMVDAYSNAGQASSVNLSELDALDDDASSFSSELTVAAVTVGGYRVKQNLAPILRDILSKYGDIAAQCSKKSNMLRSLLVENVCDIVQKLQAAEFAYITRVEIASFRVFVEDLESDGVVVGVVVGWLLERLDEISEAKKLLKGSKEVKQDINRNRQAIKQKEDQICMLEDQITCAKKELELKRDEERKLVDILSNTKAQVKRFHSRSIIADLF